MLKQKESSVMHVLFKLCAWVGKAYVFPSQRRIVKLSSKWFGVGMSRRTLNRVMSSLETGHFLERVKRHQKGPGGKMIFHSTLYKLKGRAFNLVADQRSWSEKFFGVFRVPKMAQYQALRTAGNLSPVDNWTKSGRAWEEGAARSGPINLTFRTI